MTQTKQQQNRSAKRISDISRSRYVTMSHTHEFDKTAQMVNGNILILLFIGIEVNTELLLLQKH